MVNLNEGVDYYAKWIPLLKTGKIKDVLIEATKGKQLDEKNSLECLVAISQLTYNAAKNGVQLDSFVCDISKLVDYFCSFITLQKHYVRYLHSLYHIMHFFFKKDHFEHMSNLFKTIIQVREHDLKDEGKTLYDAYIILLKKTIMKTTEKNLINHSNSTELFSLLLNMLVRNNSLSNGTLFLHTVLQAGQITSKNDLNAAVNLFTIGLGLLYKVDNIEDMDSCLCTMFQIYTCLFIYQFRLCGRQTALNTVDSHLNQVKWKFSKNLQYGECFLLLCNAVKILTWDCPEPSMLKKIHHNNRILKSFKKMSEKSCLNAVCGLMSSLLEDSHKSTKENTPVLPKSCLEPFLQMLMNVCDVLKDSKIDKTDQIKCWSVMFVFISDGSSVYDVELLKRCLHIVVQAEKHILELIQEMRSNNHVKASAYTTSILIRSANLIRTYHRAKAAEEVVTISKPICKFICSLPPDVFEDIQNQQTSEVCFTYLVNALGTRQLEKVLECIVALVLACPKSKTKAFKLWGDLKHNAVHDKKKEHLETTILAVLTERKTNLENEWLSVQVSNNEIGKLLVEELKTYFVNKYLRGKPIISAANALLGLDTDCITQGKGLVIAMDIASATENFPDEFSTYYTKSLLVINKLRKEKKHLDPVEFNCCMGDLLYAQLRCQLRYLRKDCESEVVRLSVIPHQPLVTELPEDRPNPNDTCDIPTKFNNLSLSKQRKLMENMDSALKHWGLAYAMLKEETTVDYDVTVTMKNLQDAGFMSKLYCDDIKQEKVWRLLYNMAVLVGNIDVIVTAVGEMMKITNIDVNEKWIENAKNQLSDPTLSDLVRRGFLLNNAVYNLNNNKIVEGLAILDELESVIRKNHIQFTQFLLIIGEYQKLCDWTKYNHVFSYSPSCQFSLDKAIRHLLYFDDEKRWGSFAEVCEVHCQLLQASQLLGEMNWSMDQPRDARCYLKSPLSLAQKLALPLRTVQLLLLLAWVDLSTGVIDDCVVKLEGLEDLLELCGTPLVYGKSDSSPKLNKWVILEPDYLTHSPSCSCLPCTTVEYRRLVLETITLRATFCANFGQLTDALRCFKVAIRVQEDLCKLHNNKEVLHSCVRMWIQYTNVLALSGKPQEVATVYEDSMKLFSLIRDPCIIQLWKEQKTPVQYSLLETKLQHIPIGVKTVIIKDKQTPSMSQNSYKIKTPTNRSGPGKSPLSVKHDNVACTPKPRPVRRLKLPSSDEENTPIIISEVETKYKRKLKPPPKFVSETPKSIPGPPRTPFVVFNDANAVNVPSSKTSVVKKKIIKGVDISVGASKKKLFSSDNLETDLNSEQRVPIDNKNDSIVRSSNRKTYRNTNLSHKKNSKTNNGSQSNKPKPGGKNEVKNNDAFMFGQMKNAIKDVDEMIKDTPPENKTTNLTSLTHKFNSYTAHSSKRDNDTTRSDIMTENNSRNDNDCDFIEGTPEPPKKNVLRLKPKRATRSNTCN